MKNIDVFFTTALWDEYLKVIQSDISHAEEKLKGKVEVDDNCSICAITICLLSMFDDIEKDRAYCRRMESLVPWQLDTTNRKQMYNLGVSLAIPANLFLNYNKTSFANYCKKEFIEKSYLWKKKGVEKFDKISVSEIVFNNIFS
ncbi:hypothetical protein [Novosphingobium sp. SG707]|uniref:hypothetical protein n=1 Tax=Novosphingobium sp. SG707 TaxID=2586996 RepID=UPI001444A9A8|nr:hypothetical protein [Novosphingobium sp. SG707]NKI99041.1 hypothetical protein [Novosphingobium sp. SG707]